MRPVSTPRFPAEYARLIAQFGLPEEEAQSALEGDAGEGRALARLAQQPELLVLDEPTSGLDALVRREFLEAWSIGRPGGKRCCSPATRLPRSNAWPISWPFSAKANCCWSSRSTPQGPGPQGNGYAQRRAARRRRWAARSSRSAASRGNGSRWCAAWPTSSWPCSAARKRWPT